MLLVKSKINNFEKLRCWLIRLLQPKNSKIMSWFFYAEFILLPLIFTAEVAAFALLYRHRNKRRNKHQIYLIATLCVSEFNVVLTIAIIHIVVYKNVSLTLIGIFWFYLHLFVRLTYCSAMTLLTID